MFDFEKERDKEFSALEFRNLRRTLKPSDHQTGKSIKEIDIKRKALMPGKRRSKTGKIYYEYRKNRTDKKKSMV